jgi:hypothetical protein
VINLNKINSIDTGTDEGKLLLAALAILTSITEEDVSNKKWGGMVSPDVALERIEDLAMKIFYQSDYDKYLLTKLRDDRIDSLLNSPGN